MKKKRLIELAQDIFPDLEKSCLHAFILAGDLRVDGERVRDPRRKISTEARLEIVTRRYVSRGGDKLDGALSAFGFDPSGKTMLDAGSSTGGFTDCLLQHGASRVYAVDAGYNQIDWKLRQDPRVVLYERTRIQEVGTLDPPPEAAVADLSFRSLSGIARHILDLTTEGLLIALVKPQFEIADPADEFNGVVHNVSEVLSIVTETARSLHREGAYLLEAVVSPLAGIKGNTEVFFLLGIQPAGYGSSTEQGSTPDEQITSRLRPVMEALRNLTEHEL